jgi:DNA-binding MarR family transcriptional regulator
MDSRDTDRPPFYDGGDYDVNGSIGNLMHRITAQMRRNAEKRMAVHGLTAAQWKPLWLLGRGEVDTAQALTCATETDAGAMTRMLDRLEAKGLIERTRSATDRRVVQLRLTDAGREVVRHIPFVLAEVNNAALRGFSDAEFQQFKTLLQRAHANLSDDENAA